MLQVYKRMFQGMFTLGFSPEGGAGEINNAQDMNAFISQNKADITNYLNSLDIRDERSMVGSDGQLKNLEVFKSQDKAAVDKLIKAVGLDQYSLASGVPIAEVVAKLDAFAGESAAVKKKSKTERTKTEVRGNNPEYTRTKDFAITKKHVVKSTGENISNTDVHTLFGRKSEQINNAELASEVNMGSLRAVVSSLDAASISTLVGDIASKLKPNKDGTVTFKGALGIRNHNAGVVNSAFKELKYNAKGDLGGIEAGYLHNFLLDTNENQQEVILMSKQDKINRLLDFNRNGQLDGATNFYVGEGQMKSNLTILSQMNATGQFDTLLRSIQIDPVKFEQDMNTNFFAAREMFKRHLGTAIEAGLQPQALVQGKTAEFTKTQFELQDKYISNIENELLKDPKIKNALDAADPRFARGALRSIAKEILSMELAGAGAILTPDGLGIAGTVSITDKYDISLGMNGGTPFIGVSRKMIEGERLNASVGVGVGFGDGTVKISPFASGSYLARKGYSDADIKGLFPDTLPERGFRVSGYATATFAGVNGGVSIDKNKAPVIADVVKRVGGQLDDIFDGTYVATGEDDKAMAKMLTDRYAEASKLLNETEKNQLKSSIKQGYLTYLENNLYADNSGLDLTGVSISYICGHFPIITLQAEKLKQKWSDVDNTGTAAEMLSTRLDSQLDSIGASVVNHPATGHKVVRLDWVERGNISADTASAAQVEFDADGTGAYVSGNISVLTGGTYIDPDNNRAKVLVIGNGNMNGTELVPGGYSEGITSAIPTTTKTITVDDTTKPRHSLEVRGGTASIGNAEIRFSHLDDLRSQIDTKIKSWSIINPDNTRTPLQKFQKDVVEAGRDIDSNELDGLWKTMSNSDLSAFLAKQVGPDYITSITDIDRRTRLANTPAEKLNMELEKIFVIESVMMAMRNDLATKGDSFGDDISQLKQGETLGTYYEDSTMKKRMIENLASSTAFEYSSIETAYTTLMSMQIDGVALRDMNEFKTSISHKDIVSSSGASQVIKMAELDENGRVIESYENDKMSKSLVDAGIRDTSISFSSGVHETIGISIGMSMTDVERREAISKLPNRYMQRRLNDINNTTGGNYTVEDLKTALKDRTSIGGIMVDYHAELTFTGNCLNLQLDESVTLTQVTESTGGEFLGYEKKTIQVEENDIQAKEAVFNGTRHAINSAQVFALGGGGWENDKETDASTNPGEDPVDDATTSPGGTDGSGNLGDGSTDNVDGGASGGTDGGNLLGGGPDAGSTTDTSGGVDGGINGGDLGSGTPVDNGKSTGDALLGGLTIAELAKKK